MLRATRIGEVGVVTEVLADIRKDVPSWFRGKAENTREALGYLLAKHPDFATSPRGHARLLGQIGYAEATAGDRRAALRSAGRALRRWPASPHAWLALAGATTPVDPHRVLRWSRALGRGVS